MDNLITNLPIAKQGVCLELLVEGSEQGCFYYQRMPLSNPPVIAYTPETMRILNKVVSLNPEEVQAKYGNSIKAVITDPLLTKGNSFVFDLTMYNS